MRTFKYSRIVVAVLVAVFAISLSNCVAHVGVGSRSHKKLPPGQAKKVTGEKSARRHAPGHNK